MNHRDLVKRAVAWLKHNQQYTIVINELGSSHTRETPDAIAFKGGFSILIECKASRSDFLADKKKFFRRDLEYGMGNKRYFMVPKGLVAPEEVPPMWGLLEVYEKQVRIKKHVEVFEVADVNKTAEVALLTSVIRRLEISTAVFVRYEADLGGSSG